MRKEIIFLKGLPASGKSTWAKQYCFDYPDFVRLNKDDIREELGNPKWSKQFEKEVLRLQRIRGLENMINGKSLIIDDTNFNKVHEIYWRNIADNFSIEFAEKELNKLKNEMK